MKQFRDTMYEYNTLTEEYRTKSKDRIRRQLELGGCHISTGVYLTLPPSTVVDTPNVWVVCSTQHSVFDWLKGGGLSSLCAALVSLSKSCVVFTSLVFATVLMACIPYGP